MENLKSAGTKLLRSSTSADEYRLVGFFWKVSPKYVTSFVLCHGHGLSLSGRESRPQIAACALLACAAGGVSAERAAMLQNVRSVNDLVKQRMKWGNVEQIITARRGRCSNSLITLFFKSA